MNLKERGITVGDLLIILLIILTSTIVVKSFNKGKESSLNYINQEKISYKKALLSNMYLNNLKL